MRCFSFLAHIIPSDVLNFFRVLLTHCCDQLLAISK